MVAVIDQREDMEKILRHRHLWSDTRPLAVARSSPETADEPWIRKLCDDVDPTPEYENVLAD